MSWERSGAMKEWQVQQTQEATATKLMLREKQNKLSSPVLNPPAKCLCLPLAKPNLKPEGKKAGMECQDWCLW